MLPGPGCDRWQHRKQAECQLMFCSAQFFICFMSLGPAQVLGCLSQSSTCHTCRIGGSELEQWDGPKAYAKKPSTRCSITVSVPQVEGRMFPVLTQESESSHLDGFIIVFSNECPSVSRVKKDQRMSQYLAMWILVLCLLPPGSVTSGSSPSLLLEK